MNPSTSPAREKPMLVEPLAPKPDPDEIRRTIETLHEPGELIELRALHYGRKRTDAGYFDGQHRDDLIKHAKRLNEDGVAVYVTLNPIDSQLLARCANRVQEWAKSTATDKNVTMRRWLLIDIDPQRPADTSSTEEQLAAAQAKCHAIYADLSERGWPALITAESGNGMHLLARVNLPNDDDARDLVKRCLESLASRYDDERVKVDTSVFNAARIVKLYGTVANKGDHVSIAPWRLSRVVSRPACIEVVPRQLLDRLAAEAPVKHTRSSSPPPRAQGATGNVWGEVEMAAFLARAGIEASGPDNHNGALRWKLRCCPFDPSHGLGESAVFIAADGRLGFKCMHNSCASRDWQSFRELVDGPRERRTTEGTEGTSDRANCEIREPEPLRAVLPPSAEYPMDALGEIMGGAVRCIHEVVQAPVAICAQSVLAAASLAAQAHADVELDGRRELLSLAAFTIGESGERKTAVDTLALKIHREFEQIGYDTHRMLMKEYELSLGAYEAAKKLCTRGKKSRTEIRDALESLGPAPVPPTEPLLICQTPTLEGIHKHYMTGRPSVGLFHDDGAEFLGGHAMNDDNRQKTAAGLSKLWDVGGYDRVRAGDGSSKQYGKRLALHLMIQPFVAEKVLSDDVLVKQGMLARALLCWPESTIGSRPYVSRDVSREPAMVRYFDRMSTLLERHIPLREGTNEINARTLILTDEARSLWITTHDAIEADMKDGGEYWNVKAWGSKAPAQILRIAGVLTLIENPDAGVIHEEAISRAAQLMNYYMSEAVRIVGTASVPPEVLGAEALYDWCIREGIETLHSQKAIQYGPGRIRNAEAFDAAIAVLVKRFYAVAIEGGAKVDGKLRRRAWRIVGSTP